MQFFHVDAFAERAFEGNPAAVCLLDRARPDAYLQDVAAEINLSETAFVLPGHTGFELRWFTPLVEVALCGHATLASAHVLFTSGVKGPIEFHTKSGRLSATRAEMDLVLDFPALRAQACAAPAGLEAALGTTPRHVARSSFDLIVEVEDESVVQELAPDFARLAALDARGVIVTALASRPRFDFVSRFFAPAVGLAEDPATGSAHCVLGPFWSARLGRNDLVGRQLSRRGATIGVRVRGDRVQLLGRAITVSSGTLLV